MVWVLWDILIPLMASFTLGTLLGWLIWSWRRRNRAVSESPITAGFAVDPDNSDSASIVAHENENAAYKEMEKANVVLISERDEATQAFENLQVEAEEMRDKIAALETEADESAHENTSTMAAAGIAGNSLPLTAALDLDNTDKKELDLLKSDLKQLTETLDSERKARRATELEMLNIKNRHDKLSSDFASTISVIEHNNQIGDRDEEITSLKLQLADLAQQHEEESVLQEEVALSNQEADQEPETIGETAVNFEVPEHETAQVETVQVEVAELHEADSDTPMSVAAAAGIDFPAVAAPVESQDVAIENKIPNKNGHTPNGWAVPDKKPSKKERDNLTDIKGVGPVLEKNLHDCGIYYYRQVANLDKSGMDELQQQIPQFPGRIKRDKWVKQAIALQKKKYGESA